MQSYRKKKAEQARWWLAQCERHAGRDTGWCRGVAVAGEAARRRGPSPVAQLADSWWRGINTGKERDRLSLEGVKKYGVGWYLPSTRMGIDALGASNLRQTPCCFSTFQRARIQCLRRKQDHGISFQFQWQKHQWRGPGWPGQQSIADQTKRAVPLGGSLRTVTVAATLQGLLRLTTCDYFLVGHHGVAFLPMNLSLPLRVAPYQGFMASIVVSCKRMGPDPS